MLTKGTLEAFVAVSKEHLAYAKERLEKAYMENDMIGIRTACHDMVIYAEQVKEYNYLLDICTDKEV